MKISIDKYRSVKAAAAVIMVILTLLPFHALLSTWLGTALGHLDLVRIWKELLLVPLVISTLFIAFRDPKLKKWLVNSPVVGLILAYLLLHFILSAWALKNSRVSSSALLYALIINIRFLMVYFVCFVVEAKTGLLSKHWQKIILWPAMVVIAFGLLQQFVLPADFLSHFGYSDKTIPPYQTVDQKPGYLRIQSTLRGPNPLGAYLLVVIPLFFAWLGSKNKQAKTALVVAAGLVAMFYTYSRSAWLGLILAFGLLVFWSLKKPESRALFAVWLVASSLIVASGVYVWRQNNVLENTLFHTDETSQATISSNEARTQAIMDGLQSAISHPLGNGPGTAGPASVRNAYSESKISENYYLQIAQETGLIGLVVFLGIQALVAIELWRVRNNNLLPLVLVATAAGLFVVNMLSHAWTDDTLSIIWWGLAGIATVPVILKQKVKNV